MSHLHRAHGFNFPKRWPTVDEISDHSARMAKARAARVRQMHAPTVLGFPTILDQGDTGYCFGFAAVQAIHVRRQAIGMASEIPSPAIPYWFARREEVASDDEVTDSGSDPDGMTKALADFGACPMSSDPFDASKVNERPNDVALLTAQKVTCQLQPILETGADLYLAMQHVISVERLPVIVALDVVPAFDDPPMGIVDDPSGVSRGRHAQCIYGFDEIGMLDAGSWGTSDGVNGIKRLTPKFVGVRVVWAGSLEVL